MYQYNMSKGTQYQYRSQGREGVCQSCHDSVCTWVTSTCEHIVDAVDMEVLNPSTSHIVDGT